MSLLDYNQIKEGKIIVYEGDPFEVMSSWVFRKQQRKPVNQTKLKNLLSGRIMEISFHGNDKVEEAEIDIAEIKYLYRKGSEWWFCDEDNPKNRFSLSENVIGEKGKFLKENNVVELLTFGVDEDKKIIGLRLPIKLEFRIIETPPGIRGDTATGGQKKALLETGGSVNVPLFINEGDIVRVNTVTGEYVERAS